MSAQQPPSFAPFEPPLGPQPLHPQLYSQSPTTLVIKERIMSFSGDDFYIRTVDGAEVCKVKGKVFSARDKKVFATLDDQELFTLSNRLLSIHKSFRGESPAGHDFEVQGHFKLFGSKSTVTFTNASDNSPIELQVAGKWLERSAAITIGERPVAAISRDFFNAREFFGDKQSYSVTVAPNVDLSLIAAICVSLDEQSSKE